MQDHISTAAAPTTREIKLPIRAKTGLIIAASAMVTVVGAVFVTVCYLSPETGVTFGLATPILGLTIYS